MVIVQLPTVNPTTNQILPLATVLEAWKNQFRSVWYSSVPLISESATPIAGHDPKCMYVILMVGRP
jgi:fructose-specific phosphotransferase system IIC component